MGEYLSDPDGYTVNAGTCHDWRYLRREELEAWAPVDAGTGTDCSAFLEHHATVYRFPWPDEDSGGPDGLPARRC